MPRNEAPAGGAKRKRPWQQSEKNNHQSPQSEQTDVSAPTPATGDCIDRLAVNLRLRLGNFGYSLREMAGGSYAVTHPQRGAVGQVHDLRGVRAVVRGLEGEA